MIQYKENTRNIFFEKGAFSWKIDRNSCDDSMIGRVRRLSYCVAGSWCVVNCCQQQLGQFDRKSVSENVPDPTACDRSAPGRAISQEFGTLAFPDEGNGGFALADDNEEGSNESQWGHREGEPSGSPPSASWVTS